jgi:hypothetical protein
MKAKKDDGAGVLIVNHVGLSDNNVAYTPGDRIRPLKNQLHIFQVMAAIRNRWTVFCTRFEL